MMTTKTTSTNTETNSTVRLVAALKVLGVTDDTPLHLRQLLISSILSVAKFNDDADLIDIYGESEKYYGCGVPLTLNGKLTDNRFLFFFLDGKLKRIDLWAPS
jgi:hypothetical protein